MNSNVCPLLLSPSKGKGIQPIIQISMRQTAGLQTFFFRQQYRITNQRYGCKSTGRDSTEIYANENLVAQKWVFQYKHTRRHSMVEILGRTEQKYNVAFGGRNTGSVSPIWRAPPNASLMRTACSSTQKHSCKGPLEYIYVSLSFALQKLFYSIAPPSLTPCTAFIILIRLQFISINITLNYFASSTSNHILMHHAR